MNSKLRTHSGAQTEFFESKPKVPPQFVGGFRPFVKTSRLAIETAIREARKILRE